ncbi:MAG: hypothetical protein U0324_30075 [Polyangiales bacterium]
MNSQVTPQRLVAIMVGVLAWFASLFAVPAGVGWVASAIWGPGASIVGGAVGFLFVLVGTIAGVAYGLAWSERRAVELVRREGVRCTAWVKSYRRVSMTQHRVLWVVQFPAGAAGREYMMPGLSDAWLADVCALEKPVRVIAHPEAEALVVEG